MRFIIAIMVVASSEKLFLDIAGTKTCKDWFFEADECLDKCVSDDSVQDSRGDTCSSYYDRRSSYYYDSDYDDDDTPAYCGWYDTADDEFTDGDFTDADLCVDKCTNDEDTDGFPGGYQECDWYDKYPEDCGKDTYIDSAAKCCACGGGLNRRTCPSASKASEAACKADTENCRWKGRFKAAKSCCACGGGETLECSDASKASKETCKADTQNCTWKLGGRKNRCPYDELEAADDTEYIGDGEATCCIALDCENPPAVCQTCKNYWEKQRMCEEAMQEAYESMSEEDLEAAHDAITAKCDYDYDGTNDELTCEGCLDFMHNHDPYPVPDECVDINREMMAMFECNGKNTPEFNFVEGECDMMTEFKCEDYVEDCTGEKPNPDNASKKCMTGTFLEDWTEATSEPCVSEQSMCMITKMDMGDDFDEPRRWGSGADDELFTNPTIEDWSFPTTHFSGGCVSQNMGERIGCETVSVLDMSNTMCYCEGDDCNVASMARDKILASEIKGSSTYEQPRDRRRWGEESSAAMYSTAFAASLVALSLI